MPENDQRNPRRTSGEGFERNRSRVCRAWGLRRYFAARPMLIDLAGKRRTLGHHALGCADLNTSRAAFSAAATHM
jgi:hypothetical protein